MTSGKAALILFSVAFLAVVVSMAVWMLCRYIAERSSMEERYTALILAASRRNEVDPDLIKAVIWRESGFDRTQIGGKGEVGLMQIMPDLAAADWARIKKRPLPSRASLSDPELNIEIGSWYLGRALRHWSKYQERITLALCEYNAGRSRANAWKPHQFNGSMEGRIRIESTRKYVTDILRKYAQYRQETEEARAAAAAAKK